MQKAFNLAVTAALAVVAVGLAASIVTRPAPGPTGAEIEAMIEAALDSRLAGTSAPRASAAMDTADLDAAIETFLIENPRVLERMSIALDAELRAEETAETRAALVEHAGAIYDDPANIVLGNPEGDVTLVEFFDYNCGYCRQVVADVMALAEEDPGLRIVLKEFPILSQGSMDAARVGVLVNQAGADYAAYHTALFSARGSVDIETALAAAETVGLNRVLLELDMTTPEVTAAIQRTYMLAQGLGISGTPSFIIGEEIIPGAVSKTELVSRIANMRACGATRCPPAGIAVPQEG